MKSRIIALALTVCAAGTLHAQNQSQRLTFPGLDWGERYERTASVLAGLGYSPAATPAKATRARAFVNARGDSLYAGFSEGGDLYTMTYIARLGMPQAASAFNARAAQLRSALGQPDSASASFSQWVWPTGDQLLLSREDDRLYEVYVSAEAGQELVAAANDEGQGATRGTGPSRGAGPSRASASSDAADDAGDRWVPVANNGNLAVFVDKTSAQHLPDGTWDIWTRWDHAAPASNDDGSQYDATVEHQRMDCGGERMLTLQIVEYFHGNAVTSMPNPNAEWEQSVPDTILEDVIKTFCGAVNGH